MHFKTKNINFSKQYLISFVEQCSNIFSIFF